VKVNVIVKPKEAVLDPQGNAVRDAMRHLGMPEVRSVRIGKFMEIDVAGTDAGLKKRLHRLCRDLLSNPVIEDYEMRSANGEGRKPDGKAAKTTPNTQRRTSNTQRQKKRRSAARKKKK
jgi:phosphoribosylformylglycinamidine synthase PurS subunit